MNNIVEMITSWGGLTETLFCRAFTKTILEDKEIMCL